MRWKKNIIRTMNRVAVVGSRGGSVAHSTACTIPWQKRTVEGSAIQRGGGGMLRYGMRMGDMLTGKRKKTTQRGGSFGSWIERNMFGVKRTKGKRRKNKQKGGGDPLGLTSYYKSTSKKKQRQMDDWVRKNI